MFMFFFYLVCDIRYSNHNVKIIIMIMMLIIKMESS